MMEEMYTAFKAKDTRLIVLVCFADRNLRPGCRQQTRLRH